MFYLSAASKSKLLGVHSDLCAVVEECIKITPVDFKVLEGVRSIERQKLLVASGASSTMNSRHITGHAVDLGALEDGKVVWHWPLYFKIAEAMLASGKKLGVPVEAGAYWKKFPDGPHFQLTWEAYPINK